MYVVKYNLFNFLFNNLSLFVIVEKCEELGWMLNAILDELLLLICE